MDLMSDWHMWAAEMTFTKEQQKRQNTFVPSFQLDLRTYLQLNLGPLVGA